MYGRKYFKMTTTYKQVGENLEITTEVKKTVNREQLEARIADAQEKIDKWQAILDEFDK